MNTQAVVEQVLAAIKQKEHQSDTRQVLLDIFVSANGEGLSISDVEYILMELGNPLHRFTIQKAVKRLILEGTLEFAGKHSRRNVSGGINVIPLYRIKS